MSMSLMVSILEYVGTIAFAISGALIAIENRMDIFGVIVLGCTTAVGGGLFRDILIQSDIPSMFANPSYTIVAIVTTVLVFLIMYFLKNLKIINSRLYKIGFNITDSLGLGAFVCVGALIAINAGITNSFLIIFCSVISAVGGGMIRDIMACRIPVIFRKHIYAVAAIIGALLFYFMNKANVWYPVSGSITIMSVVAIRYLAFHFELNLPKVKLNTDI